MADAKHARRLTARLREPGASVRSLRRKTAGALSHRLFKEQSFLPSEVLFFLTYRCNLKCKTCGQWGEDGYVRKGGSSIFEGELSLAELLPTLDDLATFGPRVFLCGGEILLYGEWRELLRALQERRLRTTVITNGTRLEDAVPEVIETGVEQLSLSLDGTPEVHDRIRGVQGACEKAERGMASVIREREARGRYFPRVVLNSTLSHLNYEDVPAFVERMQRFDVDGITLLHFNFLAPELWTAHERVFNRLFGSGCPGWRGFVQDPAEIDVEGIIEAVRTVKGGTYRRPVTFFPDYDEEEMRSYYRGKAFRPRESRGKCKGPWRTVNILPNGDMSPCLDVVVGNIRDPGGLRAVWNGEKSRAFRRTIKEKDLFPACTRCCTYYRF